MDTGSFPPNPGGYPGPASSFSPPRRKKLPSALKIPAAFQQQNQIISPTSEPVKRKPLPSSASPISTKPSPQQLKRVGSGKVQALQSQFSTPEPKPLPRSKTELVRPAVLQPVEESPQLVVRDLDRFPRGQSPLLPQGQNIEPGLNDHQDRRVPPIVNGASRLSHSRLASDPVPVTPDSSPKRRHKPGGDLQRAATMAHVTKPPPLHVDPSMRKPSLTDTTDAALKHPKTPGQKLTSFFSGWKTSSPGAESSATENSESGHSPFPSPTTGSPQTSAYSNRSIPPNIDTTKANSDGASYFGGPLQGTHHSDADVSTKLKEVETELKDISAELAASIKREMELEDLVEQLKMEATQSIDARRTSDYFSDSGTSSVRFPLSDLGVGKSEEMEKLKRRSELERARLKVDTSQKWQEEQVLRKDLEAQVQSLKMQIKQLQQEKTDSVPIAERARKLEASLEDARRRLVEEKQVKENFQDLLTAMHEQIQQHKNERDNLKDEIVPQLKARVEGLEADAGVTEKVQYDNSRLQQEISALRNENNSLKDARRMQVEMQQQASRFSSIAEEEGPEPPTPFSLKRSNSTARTPTGRGPNLVRSPSLTGGSLSRSNSLSGKDRETKESLADRMKDVEMQRDALHQAVKSLLDRQAYQTRENEKRVKILEAERDRALQARSPRRMGYEKEVGVLREEINHLRRRGDDALEQRWQCEKGLGGLKMDLDRAEQETMSLRSLLKAHDILLPDRSTRSEDPFHSSADEATSSSLRTALTHLEADRAAAAEGSASRSLAEEQKLADQLSTSSQRVQDLAKQVQVQLSTNHTLRVRLAEAVGRGEREQKNSATRINALQSKLKRLEDTVMVAQQQSEDSITKHESEVAIIKDSHSSQLQRVRLGLRTPVTFSPNSPLSPMSAKTPRLDHTTSGAGIGLSEKVRTEVLEKKVQELERALKEADGEMAEVVGKMNAAQMEVAELQSDRDEAMRQTRRLQAEIQNEREKVRGLMDSDS